MLLVIIIESDSSPSPGVDQFFFHGMIHRKLAMAVIHRQCIQSDISGVQAQKVSLGAIPLIVSFIDGCIYRSQVLLAQNICREWINPTLSV